MESYNCTVECWCGDVGVEVETDNGLSEIAIHLPEVRIETLGDMVAEEDLKGEISKKLSGLVSRLDDLIDELTFMRCRFQQELDELNLQNVGSGI